MRIIKPASKPAAPVRQAAKPAPRPPVKTLNKTPASSATGSNNGFAQARAINEENARQAEIRKNRAQAFRMKPNEGGADGVTVVFTDRVSAKKNILPFFMYEHHWDFEKNAPKSEVCIKDGPEMCPLCQKLGKEGVYEMMLTCIDTRPYTYKKGPKEGQTVKRARKIFAVKPSMIPKYERLFQQHNTFRGMVVKVFRDSDKAQSIGSDVQFIRFLTEAELAKYGPELSAPIDYAKAFPRPTAEELRTRYNAAGGGAVGDADFGNVDSLDDIPF